jgi:type IV pilus assembly protein PilV
MLGCAPTRMRSGEDGMTIIEVLVAMVILLVGVLGTVTLVQTGLLSTSKTTAREQGTNLARDLVERTRQADYTSMTMGLAPATLRASLPSTDSLSALSGSTFTATRRGVVYSVTVFACSIDDPTDGAGLGDTSFCAVPTGTPSPGPPPAPVAATGPNVLGLSVALGGTLLQTVCNALGSSSALFTSLMSLVSSVVPLSVCPTGTGPGSGLPVDNHADDLRRVRIDVSWNRNGAGSVSQTTLLTNPLQN